MRYNANSAIASHLLPCELSSSPMTGSSRLPTRRDRRMVEVADVLHHMLLATRSLLPLRRSRYLHTSGRGDHLACHGKSRDPTGKCAFNSRIAQSQESGARFLPAFISGIAILFSGLARGRFRSQPLPCRRKGPPGYSNDSRESREATELRGRRQTNLPCPRLARRRGLGPGRVAPSR